MGASDSKSVPCGDPRIEVADFDFRAEAMAAAEQARRLTEHDQEQQDGQIGGGVMMKRIFLDWQSPLDDVQLATALPSPPPPRHRRSWHYREGCSWLPRRNNRSPRQLLEDRTSPVPETVSVEKAQEALEYDSIYTAVLKTPLRDRRSPPPPSFLSCVNNNVAGGCADDDSSRAAGPADNNDHWIQHRPRFQKKGRL